MTKLLNVRPLFHCIDEIDQIYQICTVLGAPIDQIWLDRVKMATSLNFKFPKITPILLAKILNCSSEALNLISAMCSWDPNRRPTMS